MGKGVITLCEKLINQLPRNIGQPEIPPLETIRELCVIEAEQVEQRRVQIVDMDLVADDVESEIV